MEAEIKILVTSNYSIFKTAEGNRLLSQKNLKKIIASMRKKVHLSPIQVNENMEVIDGQHRLEALKTLGLPVHYYISYGADIHTIQDLNSNSSDWKVEDFIHTHIVNKVKDYEIYKQFADTYKFNHQITLFMLTGEHRYDKSIFNSGRFKIASIEKAVNIASKLTQIGEYYDGFRRRTFCYAFARCMNNRKFSFDEFLSKLSYQRSKLYDCASVEQYLEIIEEIYNFKRPKGDRLVLRTI